MQYIILTFLVGSLGTIIGIRLKIPAGAIVGAMATVLIFNILTGNAYVPPDIRKITQIAAGALLGSKIIRKDIYDFKKVIFPAVILIFGMIILNFSFGFLITKISSLDLATSLFATAPGGLSDMALIADEFGADAPKVVALQILRLVSILTILPIFLQLIKALMLKKEMREHQVNMRDTISKGNDRVSVVSEDVYHTHQELSSTYEEPKKIEFEDSPSVLQRGKHLFYTLCIAAAGGIAGILLNIPAGALVVSMVSVVIFNLSCGKGYFPGKLGVITQMATGTLIGSRMTSADVLELREIIIPAVVMIMGMVTLTLIIGYSIHKFCKIDLYTAILASTPGGIQEISMLAEDTGADAPKVAILHLCRLVAVISLFPIILKFVCVHFQ